MTAAQLERNSQGLSANFKKLLSYRKLHQANRAAFSKYKYIKYKKDAEKAKEAAPVEQPKQEPARQVRYLYTGDVHGGILDSQTYTGTSITVNNTPYTVTGSYSYAAGATAAVTWHNNLVASTGYTYATATTAATTGWYTVNDANSLYTISGDVIDGYGNWNIGPVDKEKVIRDHIRKLLTEGEQKSRNKFGIQLTPEEIRARQTLREMITEAEWRKYLTNGFVMVKGQSGKFYQVFISHQERIRVFEKGKHVYNLCIHTDSNCPPTDHIINMKTIIEYDEDAIYSLSNKHMTSSYGQMIVANGQARIPDKKNVVELWKSLKTA